MKNHQEINTMVVISIFIVIIHLLIYSIGATLIIKKYFKKYKNEKIKDTITCILCGAIFIILTIIGLILAIMKGISLLNEGIDVIIIIPNNIFSIIFICLLPPVFSIFMLKFALNVKSRY